MGVISPKLYLVFRGPPCRAGDSKFSVRKNSRKEFAVQLSTLVPYDALVGET